MLPHSTSFDYKLFWLVLQTTWRDLVEHQWQFLNWCIVLAVLPTCCCDVGTPRNARSNLQGWQRVHFAEWVRVTFVVNQTKPVTVRMQWHKFMERTVASASHHISPFMQCSYYILITCQTQQLVGLKPLRNHKSSQPAHS